MKLKQILWKGTRKNTTVVGSTKRRIKKKERKNYYRMN